MVKTYYPLQKDYCSKCGSKTIDHWGGEYSEDTGEKLFYKFCPKDNCSHIGHMMEFKEIPAKFLFFNYTKQAYVCRICGAIRLLPYA